MSASLEDQVAQLHRQAKEALQRGDPAAAQTLADQAVGLIRDALGEENAQFADALFVQASLARITGNLPLANQLYERAIAILEKLGGYGADLANALIILSQRYTEQGNPERAAQLRQRARQVILERLPVDENITFNLAIQLGQAAAQASAGEEEALAFDRDLAQAAAQANQPRAGLFFFSRLAGHFANQNRLEEAAQAAQQAQTWLEQTDKESLASIPGGLLNLGQVYLTLKKPDLAATVFQQASGLISDNQPATQQIRIDIAFGLAKAYRQKRDYQQAEDHYQEMLSRSAALFGRDHPRTAEAAARVGDFYLDQEFYTQARDYYDFALSIREAKLGRDDLLVAETLNDLGLCSDQTGQFAAAEKYYRRALTIREQRLTRSHPDTLTSLFNLAELARVQGDAASAEQRFREALEIPDIPPYLLALLRNNLGDLYTDTRRFDEARPLLQAALALRTQVFGAQSGKTARSLDSLGSLEFAQGNYPAAREFSEQARAVYLKDNMCRFANTAAVNIAKALAFGGDIPAAIPLLEAAVEEARAAYGAEHYQVAGVQIQLALFYAVQAEWQKVRATLLEAVKIEDNHLVEILLSASRSHAAAFLADTRRSLSLYLVALLNDPLASDADKRAGYQMIQRRKGLETRLLRMLKPGLGVPPWKITQYHDWLDDLAVLRHKLTRLQMDNPGHVSGEIPSLQLQISEIEKNLAEAGLERSVETIIFPIPAHAVSAALPEKSVLVEFIHLPDYAAGFHLGGAPPHRYAAFVLKASGDMEENIVADVDALETIFAMRKAEDSPPPVLVDLGEAAQIDAGVEDLLRAVDFGDDGKGTPRWRRKARYLYTRLIQALENELKDAAHLIFAPDGALHSLPFEILPDQNGELISDHFSTSYVQVGREVIRFWEHFNPGEPALVIADPDFDLSAAQANPLDAGETQMDERLTAMQSAPRFASLAYTLAEGQSVAAALQAPLYSGASAVEALLQESRSPEIIHIATHGFYLRRAELSGDAEDTLTARAALNDPLERSGLVLAGANAYLDLKTPPLRAQDGILFAAEIVDLNLHQTDLVCLSACQSGQGEIRLGEGLWGLRSAFSAAGCRSLVCALWQIPDQASQQLVNLFYAELLKGVPRAEALRSARRALQAAYPRDPLFWAGLVLDGSPAQLYRFKPAGTLRVATINFREWGSEPFQSEKEARDPGRDRRRFLPARAGLPGYGQDR